MPQQLLRLSARHWPARPGLGWAGEGSGVRPPFPCVPEYPDPCPQQRKQEATPPLRAGWTHPKGSWAPTCASTTHPLSCLNNPQFTVHAGVAIWPWAPTCAQVWTCARTWVCGEEQGQGPRAHSKPRRRGPPARAGRSLSVPWNPPLRTKRPPFSRRPLPPIPGASHLPQPCPTDPRGKGPELEAQSRACDQACSGRRLLQGLRDGADHVRSLGSGRRAEEGARVVAWLAQVGRHG